MNERKIAWCAITLGFVWLLCLFLVTATNHLTHDLNRIHHQLEQEGVTHDR